MMGAHGAPVALNVVNDRNSTLIDDPVRAEETLDQLRYTGVGYPLPRGQFIFLCRFVKRQV